MSSLDDILSLVSSISLMKIRVNYFVSNVYMGVVLMIIHLFCIVYRMKTDTTIVVNSSYLIFPLFFLSFRQKILGGLMLSRLRT